MVQMTILIFLKEWRKLIITGKKHEENCLS